MKNWFFVTTESLCSMRETLAGRIIFKKALRRTIITQSRKEVKIGKKPTKYFLIPVRRKISLPHARDLIDMLLMIITVQTETYDGV